MYLITSMSSRWTRIGVLSTSFILVDKQKQRLVVGDESERCHANKLM